MSIEVPPAGPQNSAPLGAAQPRPQAQTDAATAPARSTLATTFAVTVDAVPSRPPAEVLREIEAASRRYDALRAQQRELHFAHDPSQNRIVVEVRDFEGNVLRTIPPSKALDVIAGGPFD